MKQRLFLFSVLLPALFMVASLFSFGQCQESVAGGEIPAASAKARLDSTVLRRTGAETYPLGTGDVLEVVFFERRSFEDSGKLFEVTVDSDGNIYLPLIGRVAAAGKNASGLEKEIQGKLARFSENEDVRVRVKEYVSHTATLLGAFRNQGVYPLPEEMMLTEFIARNGGINSDADVERVWVVRLNGDHILVDLDSYYTSGDTSQDFLLVNGDQVFIPVKGEPLLVTIGRVAQIAVLFLQVITLAVLLNQ